MAERMNRLLARGAAACCRMLTWAPARAQDDLAALSTEFESPADLTAFQRVHEAEGSAADQLARGVVEEGWLVLEPHPSTWYQDYRGVLLFKPVSGDFVVTTHAVVSGRDGGAPRSNFSLGGLMVRTPRQITPQTWRPGQENYLFLSLGATQTPGQYTWEVKTTVNSDSQLHIEPAGGNEGTIRVARVGPHFVMLKRDGDGPWTVHRRYRRDDLPAELQVGLTCYTDWPFASRTPPAQHNFMALSGGNPDLIAQYDYVRYRRPVVPAALQGQDLSNPQAVSDQALLAAFGGE